MGEMEIQVVLDQVAVVVMVVVAALEVAHHLVDLMVELAAMVALVADFTLEELVAAVAAADLEEVVEDTTVMD